MKNQNNNSKLIQELHQLSLSAKNLAAFASKAQEIEPVALQEFLDHSILHCQRSKERYAIDSYCLSVYENWGQYENALKIAEELLDIDLEAVVIRALFRICRKIGDYGRADKLLAKYPDIQQRKDFHTLYELVYYFKVFERWNDVKAVLEKIEKNFPYSTPILKTAKNFYLQFGLLEEAERVEISLSNLPLSKKKISHKNRPSATQKNEEQLEETAVQESEYGVISTVKELHSKLDYQTRLAAMSELTRGISHEFLNPITNIRFTIQFYRDIFKGEITKERLLAIFASILEETERIGELIEQLSPITSSKSVIERFDIIARMQKNVNALALRLQESKIDVEIFPMTPVLLKADPNKFDLIINNLLVNAIESMTEEQKTISQKKSISILVEDREHTVKITFADTGKGIPSEYGEKIFDAFFTTKNKGKGLGLYTVWNVLRMYGGKITLDPEYTHGARFLIDMPKEIAEHQTLIRR